MVQVPAILERGFRTFGAGLSDTSFGASSRNSGARFSYYWSLEQVFLTLFFEQAFRTFRVKFSYFCSRFPSLFLSSAFRGSILLKQGFHIFGSGFPYFSLIEMLPGRSWRGGVGSTFLDPRHIWTNTSTTYPTISLCPRYEY
jgi:hypothetical protein